MGDDRYRNYPQGDYYNRDQPQDYGRDYGSGRNATYSSARDYAAAGMMDRGRDRQDRNRQERDQYGQRDQHGPRGTQDRGGFQGSYGSDGHRFTAGQDRGSDRSSGSQRDDDRGFIDRAGDEVRSWFGDEDAEHRREMDAHRDERADGRGGGRSSGHGQRGGRHYDEDYHNWRSSQIAALDRDYDEYRRENRSRFESEFGNWRTERQSQRDSLNRVEEHMEVVGSDGEHVATVDKVRGDRILLTKNDEDAGGRHHSIPSRWIRSVDAKVHVSKSADEAKAHWRDEERQDASEDDRNDRNRSGRAELDRSSSRTY